MNILFDLNACSIETSKVIDVRVDRGPTGDVVVILTGDSTIRTYPMLPNQAELYAEQLRSAVFRARTARTPVYQPAPPTTRLIPTMAAAQEHPEGETTALLPEPAETPRKRGRPKGSGKKHES